MLDHVQLTTLPNGTRVITSHMPGIDSLALGFYAGVGSRYESAAEAGHSHFLEHMLFKGSAKRSARAISQAVEGRGGNMNAFTNYETTVYYAVVPSDSGALALDVLGDMYLAPKLASVEVAKECRVIIEELNMYHDQPDSHVYDLAQQTLWHKHPLGAPIIGTLDSLQATTADTLRAFHQRHYTAASTVIAAAGNIDHDRFVAMCAPYAERLPSAKPASGGFKPARVSTPTKRLIADLRETEQVQAVISFRAFGFKDPRYSAFTLLNVLLGGSMSSRLFQTVREKHGLAYSISSGISPYRDAGCIQIGAGLDCTRSVKAIALIMAELKKLRTTPVGKAEFNRARDYMLGGLRLSLESSRSQMSWIGSRLLLQDKFAHPDDVIAKLKAVTLDDVRALADDLFAPDSATLALVMPRDNAATPDDHFAALYA